MTQCKFFILTKFWHFSILFLVCGNLIVMVTVIYREQIRTARNILIFNLALSDLLLGTQTPQMNCSVNTLCCSFDSAPHMFGRSNLHLAIPVSPLVQVKTISHHQSTISSSS